MQTILLPEFRSVCIPTVFPAKPSSQSHPISSFRHSFSLNPHLSFSSFPLKIQSLCKLNVNYKKLLPGVAPTSAVYAPASGDESEDAKLAQVVS